MSKPYVIYKAIRVHVSSTCCCMLLPQCLEKYQCQMQIFTHSCSHELKVYKYKVDKYKVDKYLRCSSVPHVNTKPLEVKHLEVEHLKLDDNLGCNSMEHKKTNEKMNNVVRRLRCKFFVDEHIEKIPSV